MILKNLILFLMRSCSLITKYKHQHFIKGAITKDEITACQTEIFFYIHINFKYPLPQCLECTQFSAWCGNMRGTLVNAKI